MLLNGTNINDPYPANTFCFVLKLSSAAYMQLHFRLDFFMEAKNMNPNQIAPLGAV